MKTPSTERIHIAILGARNSGKSSLINSITGQSVSLVSDIPGTTTDPVSKTMEIPGLGPCVFMDTAGFDDEGPLGEMRVARTSEILARTDFAILLFRADGRPDAGTCPDPGAEIAPISQEWYKILTDRGIPVIPVLNTEGTPGSHDSQEHSPILNEYRKRIKTLTGQNPITVNAVTGEGTGEIFRAVLKLPDRSSGPSITGNLVKQDDLVLLVMPQDSEAPKGRLILPQVQTIRELLDKGCSAVCCTPEKMEAVLGRLSGPPDLIITDSQAFEKVWKARPEGCRVTSFSILFAAYKGDINAFLHGVRVLDRLPENPHILIAEGCTHASSIEDIGRVKIPAMLKRRFGDNLRIDTVSGNDFPDDLSGYDLVIHCGACMIKSRQVLDRIRKASEQSVPITNYGLVMAWAAGILDKVTLPL